MSKFSKIFVKKKTNYKRKLRFFRIFILKIVKFCQNFDVEPLQKSVTQITGFFAKMKFLKGKFLSLSFSFYKKM